MAGKAPNLIQSGVEPVDKLLGGLASGRLYLAHGEAAGKSLFAVKFIIEGLRRGENAAMVIRYSPEDAVRRFARLGYDCLEDVYSGRLVILEYSDDIIQQISAMRSIVPILRELEWLLGETRPQRIIFDPVTQLIAGPNGDLFSRASDFAEWARSFGATVILVAGDEKPGVVNEVKPLVEESFRFEVKETPSRAIRVLVFEKSSTISPQAIEVDPSRGVFLLDRSQPSNQQVLDVAVSSEAEQEQKIERALNQPPSVALDRASSADQSSSTTGEETDLPDEYPSPVEAAEQSEGFDEPVEEEETEGGEVDEWRFEALAEVVDELVAAVSALKPESIEAVESIEIEVAQPTGPAAEEQKAAPEEMSAQAEEKQPITQCMKSAAEVSDIVSKLPEIETGLRPSPADMHAAAINPKDFSVLVIDHDRSTREMIARALGQYSLTVTDDALSGLASLRAVETDLLVLDFDLPIVDGFKLLAMIRHSFHMPIIIVSDEHLRADDRIRAFELGADYYLTKPFAAKELKCKARQLIARHRRIVSWIITEPAQEDPPSVPARHAAGSPASEPPPAEGKQFVPFSRFEAQIERRVQTASESGSFFSVVGCKLHDSEAGRDDNAIRLFDLMRSTVRDTDFISTNSQNEFVVLLADANAEGGRAFVNRLRDRVKSDLREEPSIWLRSFPDIHEARGQARTVRPYNRRSSDRRMHNA
jgi:DNA-binding response OmpR family regulator/KaiC/GvpD/RAD55 family RecA-like ATPase